MCQTISLSFHLSTLFSPVVISAAPVPKFTLLISEDVIYLVALFLGGFSKFRGNKKFQAGRLGQICITAQVVPSVTNVRKLMQAWMNDIELNCQACLLSQLTSARLSAQI